MKKTKEKDETHLLNATFLDKDGKTRKVSEVISKDDCWYLARAKAWIATHNAVKLIANKAGISKNYDVEESQNIIPDFKNELEHVVRVTIHCKAKTKGSGCVHSDEKDLTITGEANRVNTPNKGRGYLRKMAEKRAFDIAVLEHLGLYSALFSEEESADFEQKKEKEPDLMPGTTEFESITTEINAILNAKDLTTLKKTGKKIKNGIKIKKYTEKQIKFLREIYRKEYGKKSTEF
jgi:hypothetical protein